MDLLNFAGSLLDKFILSPAQAQQFKLANRQLDLQGQYLDLQRHAVDVGRQEALYSTTLKRQQATLAVVGLAVLGGSAVLVTLAMKE